MASGISLNGWVVPSPRLKTFNIQGTKRRITMDADAGRILAAVAADYHATIRPIDKGVVDDGGLAIRPARAANGYSNHASGTAVDLNWSEEGAQGSGWGAKFFADAKVRIALARIKARYGSVVQWGGDWRAKDYMHWEIKPGVSRSKVRALADKLGIDANGVRRGPL